MDRGWRFRVDYPVLPGTSRRADVVFTRVRLAVFLDGCFWHGCPDHTTAERARSNTDFWADKASIGPGGGPGDIELVLQDLNGSRSGCWLTGGRVWSVCPVRSKT